MELLVAPTERPPISNLGQTSSLPERLGCDVLWESANGMAGVQRKEVMDLISSVRDGRLGKEFEQMQQIKLRFLVIEGQPNWDREGNLMTPHTRWNLRQHMGIMLSAQTKGVMVLTSRNSLDTCSVIEYLSDWTNKDPHVSSLLARPGPSKNGWGQLDDRATAIHVMSGFPGISTELASRIFDRFGKAPIRWAVTEEELRGVPGIGKKRADVLMKALGS